MKSVQDGESTASLILNMPSWHARYYFRYYKHTYSTANSSQHADSESGKALAQDSERETSKVRNLKSTRLKTKRTLSGGKI